MSNTRLLFGPASGVLWLLGIVVLGAMVPGYDHIRQTVSEIGEVGSPMQMPFTLLLCAIAVCVVVFALGLWDVARTNGRSTLAAYLVACLAISCAGVGIFSFPHPLHNVFGLSELIGYTSPLVLALSWRRDPSARSVVRTSWFFFVLILAVLALNLVPIMGRSGALWPYVKPYYGLAQRALFASWFGWAAVIGLLLYRTSPSASPAFDTSAH